MPFLESSLTQPIESVPVDLSLLAKTMKRIPTEILVLIAIFLAGVVSVLWYVYDAKAKQRAAAAEAEAVPISQPADP